MYMYETKGMFFPRTLLIKKATHDPSVNCNIK